MEPRCEEVCPEGYYGLQCVKPCNCKREGNFVCHPVNGCVCKAGYFGENCDSRSFEGQTQEPGKKILLLFYQQFYDKNFIANLCGCFSYFSLAFVLI